MKRADAFKAGERTYIEERGCIHGHKPAVRYTSTGGCIACLKRFRQIPAQRVIVPPNEVELFKTIMAQFNWHVSDGDAQRIPSVRNDPRPPEVVPLPPATAGNPYGAGGPPRPAFIERKP